MKYLGQICHPIRQVPGNLSPNLLSQKDHFGHTSNVVFIAGYRGDRRTLRSGLEYSLYESKKWRNILCKFKIQTGQVCRNWFRLKFTTVSTREKHKSQTAGNSIVLL